MERARNCSVAVADGGAVEKVWWEKPWLLVLVAMASAIPLVWPEIPPLVDVPGHIGRYKVELDLPSSATLKKYFDFQWSLAGNLGVDLLIIPLRPLFGLELATKLIVIAIPILTVAGLLWVAVEIHGRVPPTVLFAIPFAYGYPFIYGFINFSLSMALALLAFALWLRLGDRPSGMRAAIFVPLSLIVWVAHAFGWGVLALLIWSSELIRARDRHLGMARAAAAAALACLPLAPPLLLMLVWRSGDVGGLTTGFFGFASKALALLSALRDRWLVWDSLSVAVALVLIASALLDKHLDFSRKLAIPAAVLGAIFLVTPGQVFGSAYADMRLVPFVFMLAILALRPRDNADRRIVQRLAILGLAFAAARLMGNTISFWIGDAEARRQLAAIEHIHEGAAVLFLAGDSCAERWAMPRHSHLGSLVIARKEGFSNDQWRLPGAQLLKVIYWPAGKFMSDPSEITVSRECKGRLLASAKELKNPESVRYVQRRYRTADEALAQFPRESFDYVWLIRPEGFTLRPRRDLRLVWSGLGTWLYEVKSSPNTGDSANRAGPAEASGAAPGTRAAPRPGAATGPASR